MLKPATQREAEQILAMALKLLAGRTTLQITERLTITMTPSCLKSGKPNTLTIVRHSGGIHVTVLQAIWHGDDAPFFSTYIAAAWIAMVRRAASMQPVSVLP